MLKFEFFVSADNRYTTDYFRTTALAKAHAGQLARGTGAGVDIARGGEGGWNDRYLTTASPSTVHAKGYRFERLES